MSDTVDLGASLQNPQGANFRIENVPPDIEFRPVGLTAADGAPSKGMLYKRKGTSPKVGVHLMHPRTDQSQNYNILPLAAAGYMVLGRASRWPNNDVATIHEALVLDVAAGVELLLDEGCEKVVLLGNSGGSSLAVYYQAQATAPSGQRVKVTPAGDPFDLNSFELPRAAGILLVGGHIGQGQLVGKMVDPSVVDESDPLATDPSVDMYDPANGFSVTPGESKYDESFLARFKKAQLDRVRRIDSIARRHIDEMNDAASQLDAATGGTALRLHRASKVGWHMIVYRTTADPAFVDLSIDPDDRRVFSYFSDRPDLENYGENGFARYVTPRAWLSTWSALSSNARTLDNLSKVKEPLLIVHYAGDAATRISEVTAMREISAASDKSLEIVRNVDHYGFPLTGADRRVRSQAGTDHVVAWMQDRFPT
jgi:hypothetical protein